MNLFALSGLLTGITSSTMGIFVFFKNPKSPVNRLWAFFTITATIWGFGVFKIALTKDAGAALLLWKIAHVGVIFIPVLFLHFVYVFLGKQKRWPVILAYSFGILFSILNFSGLLIRNVEWVFDSFYYDGYPSTFLYIVFFILWLSAIVFSHYELYKAFRKSSEARSNQIKHFFFATAVGYTGGATCFLPVFGLNIYPYGNFTVALYPLIMSFAIVKYRLMDIRVTITRTGVFAAVYALVLGIPLIFMTSGKAWLMGFLGESWWSVPLTLLICLSTIGPFVYIRLQKRAETILLREQYNYHKTLRQLAREITRIHNLKELLRSVINILVEAVGISHSAIYLFDEKTSQYIMREGHNHNIKPMQESIDERNPLIIYLKSQKDPLLYEEIKRRAEEDSDPVFKRLEEQMGLLRSTVVVPSFLEDKLLAFLILGDKRGSKIYSTDDLNIFSVLASQVGLAIENAQLYEDIEGQVKQRTEQLIEAQEQLIRAEKLATVGTLAGGVAHEINNPLTAVLTNVQMLLTSIKDEYDKESLLLIEEATKRCRTIVQKLMMYARKPLAEQAGVSEVDLASVISNVTAFLKYQIEQENVKFIVDAGGPLVVSGRQNEFEQMITNLILNAKDAIKAVKKTGRIWIRLYQKNGLALMEIKDEGKGIPKKNIDKVFDPFFTTKDVGKGTGLGLSICQSIAEKHGGAITASSKVGEGTTFKIRLPLIKEAKNE